MGTLGGRLNTHLDDNRKTNNSKNGIRVITVIAVGTVIIVKIVVVVVVVEVVVVVVVVVPTSRISDGGFLSICGPETVFSLW